MGEYIIYFRGKIIGGIYDDRFLVKPAQSAVIDHGNTAIVAEMIAEETGADLFEVLPEEVSAFFISVSNEPCGQA